MLLRICLKSGVSCGNITTIKVLPFRKCAFITPRMRRIITQSQLLSAPLCALVLFSGFQASSQAQERGFQFYGAPPPADFEQDAGFDGEVVTGPSDDSPGIFSRKPINFTFAVREGWDSNLFTTRTNTQSSFYTNWAAKSSRYPGPPQTPVSEIKSKLTNDRYRTTSSTYIDQSTRNPARKK